MPFLFPCRRPYPFLRQPLGNGVWGMPLQEQTVYPADNFCFFFVQDHAAVLAFVIPKEMAVGDADFAIREPLPLPPCDVLRNAPALLLCKRRHDGDEQLPLGIECPDIFLFKIALTAFLLQFPDSGKAVHGIPCEAGYALGHN